MKNFGILVIVALAAFVTLTTWVVQAQGNRATRVSYVALGGTDTNGAGLADPATQSYPALLARHLPHGSRFFNAGRACTTSDVGAAIEVPEVLATRPTLATVWFGADDLPPECGGTVPVSTFANNLDQILAALQRQHVRIFVANLPDVRLEPAAFLGTTGCIVVPPNPSEVQACKRRMIRSGPRYNAIIAREAKRRGAVLVDMYAATRALFPHPELETRTPIGEFFNARGQAVLARLFYGVMHRHGAL
jgi:lysophospholipase L1-like esterase